MRGPALVDVLIVLALKEELDALLRVEEGLCEPWTIVDADPPHHRAAFETPRGWLRVAAVRLTKMGGVAATSVAVRLAERLNPRCLAMCGVCAGHPEDTDLGDVVIADRVFQYDEGKLRPNGLRADLWVHATRDDWLRTAQELAGPALGFHGFVEPSAELCEWWVLEHLDAGRNPLRSSALRRYVSDARRAEIFEALETGRGHVVITDEGLELTEAGGIAVRERQVRHGTLVTERPYHVLVGPMGSGNAVVADGGIWQRITDNGMRKILALEMEAAAIGQLAHDRELPFVVAKGVMDHADHQKTDRFKTFAARASAEVLCRFLREVLAPGVGAGTTRLRVVLSGEFESFDDDARAQFLAALQAIPDCAALRITKVEPGCIAVELAGSVVAIRCLVDRFEAGQLGQIAGFEVSRLELLKAEAPASGTTDPNQTERRRGWLDSAILKFTSLRPAADLLRRVPAAKRPLSELFLPLNLCAYEQYGLIGASTYSLIEVWDQTRGPLLLTGERGAGKSTALYALGRELARRTNEHETSAVPVHVSAAVLADKRQRTTVPLELSDLVGPDVTWRVSLNLLIDGLDELDNDLLQAAVQCIRELDTRVFVERLAVTSRPLSTLPDFGFKRFAFLPWSRAGVSEFSTRWGATAPRELWKLSGGSPLMVTLACAYADQSAVGLIELLALVAADLRFGWGKRAAFSDVEDCCLRILLGEAGVGLDTPDQHQAFRMSHGPVLDFLEREGLVYPLSERVVLAGARSIVEYLAARACLRRPSWPDQIIGQVAMSELATMTLALELVEQPDRARARLTHMLALERGRSAFRLRAALIATRACALRGDRLPRELSVDCVEYLWRYVIDESSRWKPRRATEALAALCDANTEVAAMVEPRVLDVLNWDGKDMRETLAARDGLLHGDGGVRAAALNRCAIEDLVVRADWLRRQMYDQCQAPVPYLVAITAGLRFRELPRAPQLTAIIAGLGAGLGQGQGVASATAAALLPGEAELGAHARGLQQLVELGHCPDEVREAFLAHPGGREAAREALGSSVLANPQSGIEGDGPSFLSRLASQPIALYSFDALRTCWQLLVPALRGRTIGLSASARKQAHHGVPAALEALIGGAQWDPEPLIDVFENAQPWMLVIQDDACAHVLQELVVTSSAIREAFVGYLRRSNAARYIARPPPLSALEPLVANEEIRQIYVASLPSVWASPVRCTYRLPPSLMAHADIAEATRGFVERLIAELEFRAERRLSPTAAAEPLKRTNWLRWEDHNVVVSKLGDWLARGSSHARLVGLLANELPPPVFDALIPALESYLERPIGSEDHEDILARGLIFSALPGSERLASHAQRLIQHAFEHMSRATTGSLAAAANLCRLLPRAAARVIARQAAQLQLDIVGFPDDEADRHIRTLIEFDPAPWVDRALATHPFHIRHSANIIEALLETSHPVTQNVLAHAFWGQYWCHWTPYRLPAGRELFGQRPADLAQEWLFRFADEHIQVPAEAESEDEET